MRPLIDRGRIEQLVRWTLAERGAPAPTAEVSEAVLLKPDRGLGAPFGAQAMRAMWGATPARIGVGRAGTRYRPHTLLRFRARPPAAQGPGVPEGGPKLVGRVRGPRAA